MGLRHILDKERRENSRKMTLEAAKLMVPGEDHEIDRCTGKIDRRFKGILYVVAVGGTISIGSLFMYNHTGDNTWKGLLYGTLLTMVGAGLYCDRSISYNTGTMNGIMLSNKHKLIERKYAKELKEMRRYAEVSTADSPEESPPESLH